MTPTIEAKLGLFSNRGKIPWQDLLNLFIQMLPALLAICPVKATEATPWERRRGRKFYKEQLDLDWRAMREWGNDDADELTGIVAASTPEEYATMQAEAKAARAA